MKYISNESSIPFFFLNKWRIPNVKIVIIVSDVKTASTVRDVNFATIVIT